MSFSSRSLRAIITIIAFAMIALVPTAFATGTSKDDRKSSCNGGDYKSSSYGKSYRSTKPSNDKCKPLKDDDKCDDNDNDNDNRKYGKSYRSTKPSNDKCKPLKDDDKCDDNDNRKYGKSYGSPSHKDDDCPKPPPAPPVVTPPAPPVVLPPVEVPTSINVTKVALRPSVQAGKSISWRVVVQNNSGKAVTVTVRDRLAGVLSLSSGKNLKKGVLTWTVNLPAHGRKIITFTTRVAHTDSSRVCNTATAVADGSTTKRSRACVRILKKIVPPRVPVTG